MRTEIAIPARAMLARLAVVTLCLALAGCGTVDGIGRDISGGANRVSGWLE